MKKTLSFLALLLFIGVANAQNPFEKFGYTPKIGTLSKGKYIEHFDADSIVQIGSVLFNPFTKQITGFVTQETIYSEATLKPEIVSRWLSPDPLAEEFYEWSPYNFVKNNPIRYIDPDGRYPIDIITRSYAPFKTFGPPGLRYHGDNRGHSLDRNASYRTSATINYDTETYQSGVKGGRSYSRAEGASKGTYSNTYFENRSDGGSLDVHSYGNNADVSGSFDIDQFTKLSVTTDGDIKGDHILNIAGTISGDDFPNQESLVTDADGNTLWLGNFETGGSRTWGPLVDLPRENEGSVNININVQINVNADGIFQSVIQGDKTISIEDWNKQFNQ